MAHPLPSMYPTFILQCPILKKAYIELIPLNCFYNETEDQFLFFDQEFVREYYPANYILFRAIHYIYCFTPGAEQRIPQKELQKRYHIEEMWDYFLQEEDTIKQELSVGNSSKNEQKHFV